MHRILHIIEIQFTYILDSVEINLHIPSTQSSKVTHKDAKMHFKGVKVRDIHKISLTLCMLFLAFPRSKYIYGNNIRKSEHYFKEHLKSSSTHCITFL